jgi:CHAT domain-containing protein
MANELLPDRVREALWTHRDAIRAIQVISEEPFIPWELLYINDRKSGPDGKGFLAEWGLVRWLHSTPWPGPQLAMGNDRVSYVIPAYVDPALRLEGADAERQMLVKLFGSPREVPAESIAVTSFLQKDARECDVLHFACHGEAAQRAVMTADLLMTGTEVDGNFAQDSLSADQVKAFARFAESGPNPMVFINACQTGRAGRGIGGGVAGFVDAFLRPYSERGAGALVGALWSVDDKLAYSFAEAFYRSLKQGDALVDAVRAAREAAKNRKELTWLAYSVYGNPFARASEAP